MGPLNWRRLMDLGYWFRRERKRHVLLFRKIVSWKSRCLGSRAYSVFVSGRSKPVLFYFSFSYPLLPALSTGLIWNHWSIFKETLLLFVNQGKMRENTQNEKHKKRNTGRKTLLGCSFLWNIILCFGASGGHGNFIQSWILELALINAHWSSV